MGTSKGDPPFADPSYTVRNALDRIRFVPKWAFTDLTLKPAPDQKPSGRTPLWQVLYSASWIALGVAAGACGALFGWPGLLVSGWLALVHGTRRLQLAAVHEAAHGTFTASPGCNTVFGRMASVAFFLEEFSRYRSLHGPVHHSGRLSTDEDPSVIYLRAAGFDTGRQVSWYYRHLALTLISPAFHLRVARGRLSSHLRSPRRSSRVFMLVHLSALATLGAFLGAGTVFWAYVFPLWVPYQMSTLLRMVVEHVGWPLADGEPAPAYIDRTFDIGIGVAPPPPELHGWACFGAWLRWAAQMLLAVAIRAFILPAESPLHGSHHFFGDQRGYQWADAAFSADRFVRALWARKGRGIRFLPSYGAAVRAAFEHLASKAPGLARK